MFDIYDGQKSIDGPSNRYSAFSINSDSSIFSSSASPAKADFGIFKTVSSSVDFARTNTTQSLTVPTLVKDQFLAHDPDGYQYYAEVTALADGGFLVTWRDQSRDEDGVFRSSIKGQIFDSKGDEVGGGISFTVSDDVGYYHDVSLLSDGSILLSYMDLGRGGDADRGFVQNFSLDGVALGEPTQIGSLIDEDVREVQTLVLENGKVVVSWGQRDPNDFSDYDGYTGFLNLSRGSVSNIQKMGDEQGWDEYDVYLTSNNNGGYYASWSERSDYDPDEEYIYIWHSQEYDSQGIAVGARFDPFSDGHRISFFEQTVDLTSEQRIVFYRDYDQNQLYANLIDGENRTQFLISDVMAPTSDWGVTVLANGSLVFHWNDEDADGYGIYLEIYDNPLSETLASSIDQVLSGELRASIETDPILGTITSHLALFSEAAYNETGTLDDNGNQRVEIDSVRRQVF